MTYSRLILVIVVLLACGMNVQSARSDANQTSLPAGQCEITSGVGASLCPINSDGSSITSVGTYVAVRSSPGTATGAIDIWGTCRYIDYPPGGDTNGLFVPFRTKAEWEAFVNAAPSTTPLLLTRCSRPTTAYTNPRVAIPADTSSNPGDPYYDSMHAVNDPYICHNPSPSSVQAVDITTYARSGTTRSVSGTFTCTVPGQCNACGLCGADKTWQKNALSVFTGRDAPDYVTSNSSENDWIFTRTIYSGGPPPAANPAPPVPAQETRDLGCPTGQVGTHTQANSPTCSGGTTNWSGWYDITNTCTPICVPSWQSVLVGACSETCGGGTRDIQQNDGCGHTQTISESCNTQMCSGTWNKTPGTCTPDCDSTCTAADTYICSTSYCADAMPSTSTTYTGNACPKTGCSPASVFWGSAGNELYACSATTPALANGESTQVSYDRGMANYYYNVDGAAIATCHNGSVSLSSTSCGITDPNCFLGDVLITMADGSKKHVEDLVPGDLVQGQSRINHVLRIPHHKTRQLFYGFNGEKPYVTGGHPFMTQDGWKAIKPGQTSKEAHRVIVGQLRSGDHLITHDGSDFIIQNINKANLGQRQIYNPVLDGDHTYYANGRLVHNK